MAKETFYFRHDYNARNDDKILELRAKFGAEGYGIFWMMIETMAENENGGAKASLMGGLSLGYGVAMGRLMEIIGMCISVGLLYEEAGYYYSRRLLTHKEFRRNLSKSGSEGANKRWGGHREANSPPNGEGNAKERKGKERKEINTGEEKIIEFEIKGLGKMKIDFYSECEVWQVKELKDFLTKSQGSFEAMAMSNPIMNNCSNFNIALQEFVNMIQSSSDYKESPEYRRFFSNWISKKNGTLADFLKNSKENKSGTKKRNMNEII